jgi:hypothetical protein
MESWTILVPGARLASTAREYGKWKLLYSNGQDPLDTVDP